MTIHVGFRNVATGEIKTVKVGWSWTLFFFGPVLGIPFWIRKAYTLGGLMIGWDALCAVLPTEADWAKAIVRGGGLALAIWLGRDGNKWTAQYYLKHNWELTDPDNEEARLAAEKWALA